MVMLRENNRRRRQPERVMRVAIPESVEGVHRLLQDDREWCATALQYATSSYKNGRDRSDSTAVLLPNSAA